MPQHKQQGRQQVGTSGRQSHSKRMEVLTEHMVVVEWVSKPSWRIRIVLSCGLLHSRQCGKSSLRDLLGRGSMRPGPSAT